ncbi:SseB family protein [Streptomyces sp. WAC07149]|uniref:SseB family protein n=1 Tax=Streptomyces sp. WAC07149 TaxID=2487425 RepID=UPI0021B03534|nr:SseB family protein [Streptomyces sp. WAC07149]
MGFDEEWGRLRAEAAGRAAAEQPPTAVAEAPARDRLAEFRSRLVLVPHDERGGLWTAPLGGMDWICAFSDEAALARFAQARDETDRAWDFRRVPGAWLLDEVIPALDFPCGVALDAAGPDGTVFPPVRGIVPDSVALDGPVAA